MTADNLLLAILVVLALTLMLAGITATFLVNNMRAMRSEQQAIRRALANMDWSVTFSNIQASSRESVRLLDVIDKRLQKLEALEKLQISQSQSQFQSQFKQQRMR